MITSSLENNNDSIESILCSSSSSLGSTDAVLCGVEYHQQPHLVKFKSTFNSKQQQHLMVDEQPLQQQQAYNQIENGSYSLLSRPSMTSSSSFFDDSATNNHVTSVNYGTLNGQTFFYDTSHQQQQQNLNPSNGGKINNNIS